MSYADRDGRIVTEWLPRQPAPGQEHAADGLGVRLRSAVIGSPSIRGYVPDSVPPPATTSVSVGSPTTDVRRTLRAGHGRPSCTAGRAFCVRRAGPGSPQAVVTVIVFEQLEA